MQNETIDELLIRLKPLCFDKPKTPVICLDYLQIVPSGKETTKQGVDDSVRKLKKFQRDINTTLIVISSFNRANYTQGVSYESFKESGNIEYSADVVWGLQLYATRELKEGVTNQKSGDNLENERIESATSRAEMFEESTRQELQLLFQVLCGGGYV